MNTDVLIVGAGGGAYPAAFRLARSGYDVVMVDPKGVLGGNCLYLGCIPSKTIREMIQLLDRSKRLLEAGVNKDFSWYQDHKDSVQKIRFIQHDNELAEFPNIHFFKGVASFKNQKEAVIAEDGHEFNVTFDHAIIATGTVVSKLEFPGSELCITSDDIFSYSSSFRKVPEKMIIVGAGYIALEVASMFHSLGTEVHLLVRSDVILRNVDQDLVKMAIPGITRFHIHYKANIMGVSKNGDSLSVRYNENGQDQEITADTVMLATGRRPLLPEGTASLGIKIDSKGFISTSETLQTSIPWIYATGDVNGRAPYFHAAVREAMVAANNIIAGDHPVDYMDYLSVPVSIFTFPPISYVGKTRTTASRMNVDIVEGSYRLSTDSKGQMYDERDGEIRLFFERGSLKIVGGWVYGIDAPDLINEIGLAVSNSLTARQMADFADQHPTTNEGISKIARNFV
ncbi:MAG: dihydrolipoyl dehydrogenase [Thermoplasmata archaeon]